jgi:hypothetical protein
VSQNTTRYVDDSENATRYVDDSENERVRAVREHDLPPTVVDRYLDGMGEVMQYHGASRGWK